jgi:hypothetical protein
VKTTKLLAGFRKLSKICMIIGFCLAAAAATQAQTFTSLAGFDSASGDYPQYGSLVQGLNGNFYGTAPIGGANGGGTR